MPLLASAATAAGTPFLMPSTPALTPLMIWGARAGRGCVCGLVPGGARRGAGRAQPLGHCCCRCRRSRRCRRAATAARQVVHARMRRSGVASHGRGARRGAGTGAAPTGGTICWSGLGTTAGGVPCPAMPRAAALSAPPSCCWPSAGAPLRPRAGGRGSASARQGRRASVCSCGGRRAQRGARRGAPDLCAPRPCSGPMLLCGACPSAWRGSRGRRRPLRHRGLPILRGQAPGGEPRAPGPRCCARPKASGRARRRGAPSRGPPPAALIWGSCPLPPDAPAFRASSTAARRMVATGCWKRWSPALSPPAPARRAGPLLAPWDRTFPRCWRAGRDFGAE
jgi:hypothetical protein